MATTWEVVSEGAIIQTSDGDKQDCVVRVVFDCPDHPNPDTEDGMYTFDQEVYLSTDSAQRTATMDAYANDYQSGFCTSLAG